MSNQASLAVERLAATTRHIIGGESSSNGIKTVMVIGAGLMGAGIAQVSAHHGFNVILCDITSEALENGRRIISKSLVSVAKSSNPKSSSSDRSEFASSVLSRITFTTDKLASVKDADLVIEAIVENLKIKQALFSELDRHAKEGCIFTSNTSSLSIEDIAKTCGDVRKTRFGGLHFFNPVPMMALVEVIRTPQTSTEAYDSMMDYCKRIQKVPITCKDTPGFIVNRLLVPFMREALGILERGDATIEDIDLGMQLGAGQPLGPFHLADFLGLDTYKYIVDGWRERFGHLDPSNLPVPVEMMKRSPTLDALVASGKIGRKAGEGFFKYGADGNVAKGKGK